MRNNGECRIYDLTHAPSSSLSYVMLLPFRPFLRFFAVRKCNFCFARMVVTIVVVVLAVVVATIMFMMPLRLWIKHSQAGAFVVLYFLCTYYGVWPRVSADEQTNQQTQPIWPGTIRGTNILVRHTHTQKARESANPLYICSLINEWKMRCSCRQCCRCR